MIWLSKGGVLGSLNELEIRTITQTSPRVWGYGGLKAGTVTIHTLLKAVNNTIDIGESGTPFHDIYSMYGHIGDLTVTQGIKTDTIYSLTNVDLTLKPYSGKKIKLDGDVQVTGSLSSSVPSHTHAASDVNSGTLHVDRIPTISYGKTDFANQNLLQTSDAVFSTVKGTNAAGALKAGNEAAVGWDTDYVSLAAFNKHLLLATPSGKNVYVQRNLHVYGNITCDGTVSNSIQKGTATTNSSGTATVTFATAFSSTPVITCTPVDSNGRSISIVITSQSTTGFTVKATVTGSHNHVIGNNSAIYNTDSGGSHSHSYTDYYANGSTGATTITGTHNHVVANNNQSLTTGSTSGHTHSYVDYYAAGNTQNTSINESHSHVVGNSNHQLTTQGAGSHSHAYTVYYADGNTFDASPVSNLAVSFNWIAV
jgi:hypothetical protein